MVDFAVKHYISPFRILAFKRELEQSLRTPRAQLVDRQDAKLRSLIAYSAAHVPFYRRFFAEQSIRPAAIRTQEDLQALPVVTKRMIRENPSDFLSDSSRRLRPHPASTSGSTGDAFRFVVGADSKAAIFALMWHTWGANGYRPYDRWMNFKGYAFTDGSLMKYSRTTNCIGIPCRAVTDEVAEAIYSAMLTFRPRHIMGYSSFIYDFCQRYKGDQRLRELGIRQITTSSEMLYDFQRAAIQEAFNCKVYTLYHQVEQVCFIYECAAQVKHLAHEYGILEVLDEGGGRVERGKMGSMVCTGFYNRAMPFIRYKLDDLIVVSPSDMPCSCGRYHQVIHSLEGRGSDMVVSRTGRRYNHMDVAFHDLEGLSGLQIIQKELASLEVRLVRNARWNEAMLTELRSSIASYTNNEFDLKFSFVSEIEKTKNGKQRLVVSYL